MARIASTGAGELSVDNITSNGGSWYGGLAWSFDGFPGGSGVLTNPGFELGGWDTIYGWTWWAETGGSYPSLLIVTTDPQEGSQHIKTWGRASGRDSTGVSQDLRAEEGQTWELDCWTEHLAGDDISGTDNYVEMRIDFFDGYSDQPLASNSAVILDGTSPTGVWIDNTPIQCTAPAGTTIVRATVKFVNPTGQSGAVFFDSISFDVVSGPPAFDLADYSLLADVKGDANTGAGEAYGHYQLRIEDSDGDRLVFESQVPADGNWLTFGGSLDQAIEKNNMDATTNGVFDVDSDSYNVVLLFDPDRSPSWGTGGALTVDNLRLTNDRTDGSDFSGELIWTDLPQSSIIDPQRLMLTADVKGNVVGGKYELTLQGYIGVPNVDEDFAAITTDTELQLAEPGDSGGGAVDWNSEIDNDEVFFATVNATVTETGGAWVRALTTGGAGDDGSCMQIEVRDIWPQETGFWYAGAVWRNQVLGSTDLSQVTMTADVKGTWNSSWLQEPAKYILRIEDPDGDWIGFKDVYDGSYHTIGGLLSNANTSGLEASGNGVFDLDTTLDYRIVVMYFGMGAPAPSYGNWGGTLTIDNVYLSPSPTPKLIKAGSVTFSEVADGTFQAVGGVVAEGESTWAPVGGQFYPEVGTNIYDWDSGIEGETAFAGFGWGSSIETASAQGCIDCGVGGTGGGFFTVTGIESPPGYYWAGVAWPGVEIDMSNPSQASFTVDVKGVWNSAEGETPGAVTVRIEDENGVRISWDSPAVDGSFNTLGGTLNTFSAASGFDYDSPSYIVTIIVWGYRSPSWGRGATVYFDNLLVTDPSGAVISEDFNTVTGPTAGLMEGMDAFAVKVSMVDGVYTWDTNSSLIVDNVLFTPIASSLDADSDLDLADYAVFQQCYSGDGGGIAAGCENADADSDNDVDVDDYSIMSTFFTGPQ